MCTKFDLCSFCIFMLEEVSVFTHFGPWGPCPLPLSALIDNGPIYSQGAICVPSLALLAFAVFLLEEVSVFTHFCPWGSCPLPLGVLTDKGLVNSLGVICVPSLTSVAFVFLC